MSISNQVREMLKTYKAQVELLQLSMTSSLAGLIYSEFIKNFRQVIHPVHKIFIPELKLVRDLLDPDGQCMIYLSENIVDNIINNQLFQEYSNVEDFSIFQEENIEILKTIVDLYIIRNIHRSIPTVISSKFGLGNPNNQLFIESNDIDLFQRKPFNGNHFKYIVDQTVLYMLNISPKVEKNISMVTNNKEISIGNDNNTILTIGHENAITVIHFNKQIFDNKEIMDILSFVTSTTVTPIMNDDNSTIGSYNITTNPYNQVAITKLPPPTKNNI